MSCANNSSNVNETFIIEPFLAEDIYTTGTTLIGKTIYFNRTDILSAYTADLSSFSTTGIYVTGGTYSNGIATFINNSGGTYSVSGFTTPFTGGTVSGATTFTGGLSASTISATTYQNLPIDMFVTGGTYAAGTATYRNNTGGTFSVTGFSTGYTLTSSAITSTLGYTPYSSTNPNQYISGITFSNVTTALGYTPVSADTNTYTTGGTFSSGTAIFTNNTGGTFSVSGFTTPFTGGTVSGVTTFTNNLNAKTFTATSVSTTGNISGGNYNNLLPATNNLLTIGNTFTNWANVFSTNFSSPNNLVMNVSGGTEAARFFNNGNLSIGTNIDSGFKIDILGDSRIQGGLTATIISATTISATTYNGYLPYNSTNPNGYITGFTDTYVTGGTYSAGTATFKNNFNNSFNVTGFSTSIATAFTGGTVSGATTFTSGVTANTISATTISGGDIDYMLMSSFRNTYNY